MKRRLSSILVSILVVTAVAIPILWACAPEGPSLAFTWAIHPDLPLNGFAGGRLGIIQPTYARSYLVVAYRHLNGSPLTPSEKIGVLSLWDSRLHGGVVLPPEQKTDQQPEPPDWAKTRAKFTQKPAPEPATFKWDENFYRPNVTDNALEVAAATLLDRAKRWKPTVLAEWIRAQDAVFATNGKIKPTIEPAASNQDTLFQKDRAYQIACAHFYAGEFGDARAAFTAISHDSTSPWSRLSAYLIGRSWLQEGIVAKESEAGSRCYTEAHNTFKGIREGGLPQKQALLAPEPLNDAELLEAVEAGEQRSLALGEPEAASRKMAQEILKHGGSKDFGDLLGRYTNLMDASITGESGDSEDHHKPRDISSGFLHDDLTEWVFRFRETGPRAYTLAFRRWKEWKSLPWLLMALMNGEPSSKGIEEVLLASAEVPPSHPGFESLSFHRARILVAQGKGDEAKVIVATFLTGDPKNGTPSSLNLWRALRMPLAPDLDTFLADALRTPAGAYGYGGEDRPKASSLTTWSSGLQASHPDIKKMLKGVQPSPKFIQGDASKVLNLETPTQVLWQLTQRPGLPPHLRREWVRAAWVRAVLLDQLDLAAEVTPDLISLEPELRPSLAGFAQASVEERSRLALLTLLRNPGMRWMVFQGINRRNFTEPGEKPIPLNQRDTFLGACWWPGPKWGRRDGFHEEVTESYIWGAWFYYPQPHAMERPLFALLGGKTPKTPWLTKEQLDRGRKEGQSLLALEDGPDWLTEHTLAWALATPEDPRIPEALHHAVRAEKVGGEKRTGTKCFKLLHTRYKESPWAAKTPIHY